MRCALEHDYILLKLVTQVHTYFLLLLGLLISGLPSVNYGEKPALSHSYTNW